ncbi:MAG: aspartate aminotransferase family protein [Chthonomonas sp.]|nr:aspartate aminotransferase family protein [Chthonomonas sp.]
MDADAVLAHVVSGYQNHINPNLAKLMNFAGFGVEARAEGCYVWDHEGNRYLDCLGGYGVFSLGHRHPKVVQAVKDQLDLMPLSSKVFFGPRQAELATKLAEVAPEGLDYTFFSNSGTEAVEAALKFAKGTKGASKIVSTIGSYHGKTLGALSVTGREKYQTKFAPLVPGAVFVPFGDTAAMLAAIDGDTAAVILEVVQGEGGINLAPAGYMTAVRKACDEHDVLLIVDEVQTGMGRTGTMFACEHEGIRPDIMTLAKCLGGGVMPIGATMFTRRVYDRVYGDNPLMHTSTFGGNGLACAAGIATLEVIAEEGLIEKSRDTGAYFMARLREVQAKHPDTVSEVRGLGLMIGLEFSLDEVGELTIAQMTKRGLIAAYTLNNPRVIRIEPPLIITREQCDFAASVIDEALSETEALLAALV